MTIHSNIKHNETAYLGRKGVAYTQLNPFIQGNLSYSPYNISPAVIRKDYIGIGQYSLEVLDLNHSTL